MGGLRRHRPRPGLCCGRPLYDFGFLGAAKRSLERIPHALRDPIERGVPLVGLEPSCVSVFRDELRGLLPDDPLAARLREQACTFGDFLKRAHGRDLPRLDRRAVVHGHCHQKAVLGMDGERDVLSAMGVEHEILDAGCCGMAGSFGFEEGDKYTVSIQCGEGALLPAVRAAPKEALIVADGFSCREQIRQTTDRQALHLAQVVRMGMLHGPSGPAGDYPERAYLPRPGDVHVTPPEVALALLAAPAGAGLLLMWRAARWQAGEQRRAQRRARRRRAAAGAVVGALAGLGLFAGMRRVLVGIRASAGARGAGGA